MIGEAGEASCDSDTCGATRDAPLSLVDLVPNKILGFLASLMTLPLMLSALGWRPDVRRLSSACH
jgi:hypothetical protein